MKKAKQETQPKRQIALVRATISELAAELSLISARVEEADVAHYNAKYRAHNETTPPELAKRWSHAGKEPIASLLKRNSWIEEPAGWMEVYRQTCAFEQARSEAERRHDVPALLAEYERLVAWEANLRRAILMAPVETPEEAAIKIDVAQFLMLRDTDDWTDDADAAHEALKKLVSEVSVFSTAPANAPAKAPRSATPPIFPRPR